MLTTTNAVLGIAVLSIVLGFVALIKQKTFIDATTNQPTEFELPLVGKLKTNYPSLLFVMVGFGLVLRVPSGTDSGKEEWAITGSLRTDSIAPAWEDGSLTVFPSDFRVSVSSQGAFKITALLPKGMTFEDVVEYFDFSHPKGSVQFYPKDQFARFTQRDTTSLIRGATPRTRTLKPLTLTSY